MREIPYQREKAVEYARAWALGRNRAYLDFTDLGGDCTNFVSQCIFQGIGVMNYSPVNGWYYIDGYHKAPSWTAVMHLRSFLLNNAFVGPFATVTTREQILPGDIIQLRNVGGEYYHSMVVLENNGEDIHIAAHTYDAYMRPLSSYYFQEASYLRILGGKE
jgi:hypothetical protein